MRELFIYYRVPSGSVGAVQEQVQALHRQLCADTANLRARLLRRPDADASGQVTFMETYAIEPPDAEGVDAAMQARIEAAAARQVTSLAEVRHVEVFVALTPD